MYELKRVGIENHTLGEIIPSRQEGSGLWQPDWGATVEVRRDTMLGAIADTTLIGNIAIGHYQDWAELDWKKQHGSMDMLHRLNMKFMEEAGDIDKSEVLQAHLDVLKHPTQQLYKTKLIDELGDALWAGSGLLSNGGFDLERATVQRLTAQNQPINPNESLTLDIIDGLYENGFKPLIGVEQSILNEEDREEDYMTAKVCWPLLATVLNRLVSMQYEHEPQDLNGTPKYTSMLGRYGADSLLFAGYIAHAWGGGTLKDVVANNVLKITQRVATKTIDKTDGARSQ